MIKEIERTLIMDEQKRIEREEAMSEFYDVVLGRKSVRTYDGRDLTEEDRREFQEQADHFTITRLMKILDLFMSLETEMRYSSSPRMALEGAALKCCVRTLEPDAQSLTDRIEELENQIRELSEKISSGVFSTQTTGMKKTHSGNGKSISEAVKSAAGMKPAAEAASAQHGTYKDIWKGTMERLQKQEPGLWSMLSCGSVIREEQGVFIWQPDDEKSGSFYVAPLNKEEKKERISRILTEITGQKCEFQAAHRQMESKALQNGSDSGLQKLTEMFGRDAIQVIHDES